MPTKLDFEGRWQTKLAAGIDDVAGREKRMRVMAGGECFSDESDRADIIRWSADVMNRLSRLVDLAARREIMTRCACHYPAEDLQVIRAHYEATGDLKQAHRMLQQQFEALLRDRLGLEEDLIAGIVDKGWGSAGILNGSTIVATKIPKSEFLSEYLAERDPEKRRQLYCHCPRVRDAMRLHLPIPMEYCYCGAGFYQDIWQTILGQPVEVELLESILMGNDVCTVAIHLPESR